MIARIRKALDEKEQGFTLIELLVVIIIIGILAAIAIPAFLNQRRNAWVSQVESDLKNAAIAAESYAVAHNGAYSGLTLAELEANGFNATTVVDVTVTAADVDSYTLQADHDQMTAATDIWVYDSETGVIDGP